MIEEIAPVIELQVQVHDGSIKKVKALSRFHSSVAIAVQLCDETVELLGQEPIMEDKAIPEVHQTNVHWSARDGVLKCWYAKDGGWKRKQT